MCSMVQMLQMVNTPLTKLCIQQQTSDPNMWQHIIIKARVLLLLPWQHATRVQEAISLIKLGHCKEG